VSPRSLPAVRVALTRERLGVAFVVLLAAGLAVFGVREGVRVVKMRQELRALEREVESMSARQQKLAVQAERLRNDPSYIEKLAREEMGMVREGETILKFPSQK
jgi:cell division protein FtsB